MAIRFVLLVGAATAAAVYGLSRKRRQGLKAAEEKNEHEKKTAVGLAEKERRDQIEEELHTPEDDRHNAKEKRERPKPGGRGGRPRDTPLEDREKQPKREITSRLPKPEIVCWTREREWVAAVEAPQDPLGHSNLLVLQNGSPLRQVESTEGYWFLEHLDGQVVVRCDEDTGESTIPLGDSCLLIFKLLGEDRNRGRHVKAPSSGWYLVIVPSNWERDEALCGTPFVAPERVSLPGHQAHFFIFDKGGDGQIAFRTPAGDVVRVRSTSPRFELVAPD